MVQVRRLVGIKSFLYKTKPRVRESETVEDEDPEVKRVTEMKPLGVEEAGSTGQTVEGARSGGGGECPCRKSMGGGPHQTKP